MRPSLLCFVWFTLLLSVDVHCEYDYIYDCDMANFLDADGNIIEGSGYKYFLCIQKKRRRDNLIDKEPDTEEEVPEEVEQDHNMVFSLSNIPLENLEHSDTHAYELVGLVDSKNKRVAMIESYMSSTIKEDVMDDVLQRFTRSRYFSVDRVSDHDFDYEVSVAAHLSMEDVVALRNKADKMINAGKRVAKDNVLTRLPMYGYFKRILWPFMRGLYEQSTNYLPIGLSASGLLSYLYTEQIRKAILVKEKEEPVDFTGCPVLVRVSTTELLADMHSQNITDRLFTVRNTIGEIYSNAVETGGLNREFQTTGRFREFLSDACHCPRCGVNGDEVGSNFGNCDVDVVVDSGFMFVNLLEMYQGDPNSTVSEINNIVTYIRGPANWTFKPRTTYEILAKFSGIDKVTYNIKGNKCGCQPCPTEETESSKYTADTAVMTANMAVAVGLSLAIVAMHRGLIRLRARILN